MCDKLFIMKTKTKIYSFAVALLFVGVFFVGVGNVKAENYYDCYSGCIDGGTDGPDCQDGCSYLLNSDGESTPYVTDQAKAQCDSEGGAIDPNDGVCRCTGDMVPNAAGNCVSPSSISSDCNPGCEGGEVCQSGVCVSNSVSAPAPVSDSTCDASTSCWFYNCCSKDSTKTSTSTAPTATKQQIAQSNATALATSSQAQAANRDFLATQQNVKNVCSESGALASSAVCAKAQADMVAAQKALDDAISANLNAVQNANRISGNPTTGAGFSLCANGILATICEGGGGTPYVAGISTGNYGGGGSGGFGSYGGGSGMVNSPKCETGFTDIGGVCFPGNTGLSNAPIYVIVSNIFSWLMGLFTTLAVVAFVVSGIQYFMASGDEHMAETAKDNAKNASIGILVGLSGFIIIKAIAAALSGTSYFF